MELLNERINYLAHRLQKNEESVKNMNLRSLSSLDDKISRTADGSNRKQRNSSEKELMEMSKVFEDLKCEQKSCNDQIDQSISQLKQSIAELKLEVKSKITERPNTCDWQIKMNSLEFEMKDLVNSVKLEMAKSQQGHISKFINITKEQISNFRVEMDEKLKTQ